MGNIVLELVMPKRTDRKHDLYLYDACHINMSEVFIPTKDKHLAQQFIDSYTTAFKEWGAVEFETLEDLESIYER